MFKRTVQEGPALEGGAGVHGGYDYHTRCLA